MQAFTDARTDDTPDEIWLVEHDPVFTLGQAGKPEHVLMPGDIPVIHVDRGGQVTYHGPGQIVAYPLLDLKRLKVGVREYVNRIEQADHRHARRLEHRRAAPRRRARRVRERCEGRRARHPRAPRLHLPRPRIQHRDGPGALPPHQSVRLCGPAGGRDGRPRRPRTTSTPSNPSCWSTSPYNSACGSSPRPPNCSRRPSP